MRFLTSCRCAWQGIKYCFLKEKNFQIQLAIALIIYLGGVLLKLKSSEWVMILFCTALVLSLELVNTAIERLSDIVCESIHPVIKQVKDIAAGAVFLVSVISAIIGCIIFIPRILLLIHF